MRRTAAVYALPALVVAFAWLRLERASPRGWDALAAAALALAPALAPRLAWRLAAAVPATLLAAWLALGVPPEHDFAAPAARRFGAGLLDFYDVALPFDPARREEMHGVLVLAVFGFCLALALALASRRALVGVVVVAAGAGWPATLVAGGSALAAGALILAACLVVLAGLGLRALAGARTAVVAGGALVAAALAASTSAAVAKDGLLQWQRWDFYDKPQPPVSVEYVWNASYDGIRFPKRKTVVLRVKGPQRSLYWRATTLDLFTQDRWIESLFYQPGLALGDPLTPPAARNRAAWVRQEVTIEALRDDRLLAAATPVAFDELPDRPVAELSGGVVTLAGGLRRGDRYVVWSYAPRPGPAALVRSQPVYPRAAGRYLTLGRTELPAFGLPGRAAVVAGLFADERYFDLWPYRGVWTLAREVAAGARSPYEAAIAIESWLRATGGFAYDESPPRPLGGAPPLADFALRSRRGYCQQFAGTMALMLRLLGVPARVAAGFTSGEYDAKTRTWTVTDHNAHAWVEVWFRDYGWLSFDPTPGRGSLSAPYTTSAIESDPAALDELARASPRVARNLDPTAGYVAGERESERLAAPVRERRQASLLGLLALVAAALLAALWTAKAALRRSRYLTRDPRRLAAAARRELADFLADQGTAVPASASLGELRAVVERELGASAAGLTAALGAARFGPPAAAADAARRARRELAGVLAAARSRIGLAGRLRGFLALRSLGLRG